MQVTDHNSHLCQHSGQPILQCLLSAVQVAKKAQSAQQNTNAAALVIGHGIPSSVSSSELTAAHWHSLTVVANTIPANHTRAADFTQFTIVPPAQQTWKTAASTSRNLMMLFSFGHSDIKKKKKILNSFLVLLK